MSDEQTQTGSLSPRPATADTLDLGPARAPTNWRSSWVSLAIICLAITAFWSLVRGGTQAANTSLPIQTSSQSSGAPVAALSQVAQAAALSVEVAGQATQVVYCGGGGSSGPAFGSAVIFPGATLPAPPFTLLLRIRTNRGSMHTIPRNEYQDLVAWGAGPSIDRSVELRLTPQGNLQYFERVDGVETSVTSTQTLAGNGWHSVGVIRPSAGTVFLYVDGSFVADSIVKALEPSQIIPEAKAARLWHAANDNVFQGDMGALRIYRATLSLTQLSTISVASPCGASGSAKSSATPRYDPAVQQPAPAVQQPSPAVQQPAPAVQQPVPAAQQPAPALQQLAPALQQPAVQQPAVQQPAQLAPAIPLVATPVRPVPQKIPALRPPASAPAAIPQTVPRAPATPGLLAAPKTLANAPALLPVSAKPALPPAAANLSGSAGLPAGPPRFPLNTSSPSSAQPWQIRQRNATVWRWRGPNATGGVAKAPPKKHAPWQSTTLIPLTTPPESRRKECDAECKLEYEENARGGWAKANGTHRACTWLKGGRPRLLFMEGCSSSTFVQVFARKLLRLHGICPAGRFEPLNAISSEYINLEFPNATYNNSGMMKNKIRRLWHQGLTTVFKAGVGNLKPDHMEVLKEVGVKGVVVWRSNILDKAICDLRDCFAAKDLGSTVDVNGSSINICFTRRFVKVKVFAQFNIKPLLRYLEEERNHGFRMSSRLANYGIPEVDVLPVEALSDFEWTNDTEIFENGFRAWSRFLRSWEVPTDDAKLRATMNEVRGTRKAPPPQWKTIYNYDQVKQTLEEYAHLRWLLRSRAPIEPVAAR